MKVRLSYNDYFGCCYAKGLLYKIVTIFPCIGMSSRLCCIALATGMTDNGYRVNTADLVAIRHDSFFTLTNLAARAFPLGCIALRYSALGYAVKKMRSLGLVELR